MDPICRYTLNDPRNPRDPQSRNDRQAIGLCGDRAITWLHHSGIEGQDPAFGDPGTERGVIARIPPLGCV